MAHKETTKKGQTVNHYLNTKHSHLPLMWRFSEDLLKLYILQSEIALLNVGGAVENNHTRLHCAD